MRESDGRRPTFSFIIPTYNRAQLVKRAVESVLVQDRDDFEVIVVDDGSNDETPDVIGAFAGSPLRYLHQERAGATSARNLGADEARGAFLVFLDSDDELVGGWGDAFAEAVTADVGLVSCDCWREDASGARTRGSAWNLDSLANGARALMQSGTYAVSRSVFLSIGGFDPVLVSGHHTDLCLKLLPSLEVEGRAAVHLEDPLVVHHLGAPHSIRRNDPVVLQGAEQLIQRHQSALRRNPTVLADFHGVAGVSAARLGQVQRARRHFASAVMHDPGDLKRWVRVFLSCVPGATRAWRRGGGE